MNVWNHRTGEPMPLQALSAGTSLTLCGVTPAAAHCSVLEPQRLPHIQKDMHLTFTGINT